MFVCGYLVLLVVVATCFCSVYGGGFETFLLTFNNVAFNFCFFLIYMS